MKNNKKGFTLVELLAVIAILAILVIIALPNVLDLFTSARKSAFHTEVREVFKQAQTQFVTDSVLVSGSNTRTYASSGGDATLMLQGGTGGNSSFKYCVKMDNQGKVLKMKVSNGTYYYEFVSSTEEPVVAPLTDGAAIEVSDVKEIGTATDKAYTAASCN